MLDGRLGRRHRPGRSDAWWVKKSHPAAGREWKMGAISAGTSSRNSVPRGRATQMSGRKADPARIRAAESSATCGLIPCRVRAAPPIRCRRNSDRFEQRPDHGRCDATLVLEMRVCRNDPMSSLVARGRSYSGSGRAMNTGRLLSRRTVSATEPSTARCTPLRPCEPMQMASAPSLSAASKIARAALS